MRHGSNEAVCCLLKRVRAFANLLIEKHHYDWMKGFVMRNWRRLFWLLFGLHVATPLQAAVFAEDESQGLGKVYLANSGSPDAQAAFNRGLAALHSFWYSEARDAFQEAQAIDDNFALAYWGEALTHDYPFGSNPDVETAKAILNRLGRNAGARQTKAVTDMEKRLLGAVEALFGEGEREEREDNYFSVMRDLHSDYPHDVEIASFYALSILGKSTLGQDFQDLMKAAAVLEPFFDRYPEHPGVVHYLIHAYDDPVHAVLGLRMANVYARIAPESSHALHMPAHIYVQLGMWFEAEESNERSFNSSVTSATARGLDGNAYDTHSLNWLMYTQLQLGKVDAARGSLRKVKEIARDTGNTFSIAQDAMMTSRFAIETGEWDVADSAQVADDFTSTMMKTSVLIGAGMAAAAQKDFEEARAIVSSLELLGAQEEASENISRANRIRAARLVIETSIADNQNELEKAIELARLAAQVERQLPLPVGPPSPYQPAHELLGELLLKSGDASGAIVAYQMALERTPQRPPALLGLLLAAEAANDRALAEQTRATLSKFWAEADHEVTTRI
ncbi:hypothetical protein PUV54_09280 [Hyphococcus flavus]|uniref:Tetratricopeptide repeat protein n=1 Tax=Hyphococcus flavus TaxID=1866326 RepID=A0AAE9ZH89_9PROT|nr:hypothetical protein [Hyphococcus flavus]WDI30150.1 hypothetical protein PUV54_09280 [Hyphococcus flavus]